jgi:hypothetical protein
MTDLSYMIVRLIFSISWRTHRSSRSSRVLCLVSEILENFSSLDLDWTVGHISTEMLSVSDCLSVSDYPLWIFATYEVFLSLLLPFKA